MGNGNMNNNNTYNRNIGAGVVDLSKDDIERFLAAEDECYKNKHDSFDAARVHYHLAEVYRLAVSVLNGTWIQGRAIVFGIQYPTLREVWAANYTDRILHHDVAPFIERAAEKVHSRNGDVSHGNRHGHSSFTAAVQIQENMKLMPYGYVAKRDLSGYFMSINKAMAAGMTIREIGDNPRNELIYSLIAHNPTTNCVRRSEQALLDKIPVNKSLFHAKDGYGLPIGNFYSQLVANMFLDRIDALHLSKKWFGRILYTRFVDDICVIGNSPEDINEFFTDVEKILTEMGLKLNARKKYMQPVANGVTYCGYVIHPHGIYNYNRIVKSCEYKVSECNVDLDSARHLIDSLNSYFGFFVHCKSFNVQRRIAKMVSDKFSEFITQHLKGQQIVFQIAEKYKLSTISQNQITDFEQFIKQSKDDIRKIYQRGHGPCRSGERKRSRRPKNRAGTGR